MLTFQGKEIWQAERGKNEKRMSEDSRNEENLKRKRNFAREANDRKREMRVARRGQEERHGNK
jgi:hypothetical protein